MVIGESVLKDLVRPIIWFGLRWIVLFLPVGVELSLYRAMGRALYPLARGKRDQLVSGLSSLLGDGEEYAPVARECMENHFVNRYLNFSFSKIRRSTLCRYARVEGLDRLDAALGRGRGCVLVHAHFGPSQLPLFALGFAGYRVNQIGAPDVWGLSKLGRYCLRKFREDEKKIPVRIIQADGFLRPAFECLKRNEVLMTAGDGTGGGRFIGRGRPFDFMGRRLVFPLGAASLAARTGAAYIPLFTLPEGRRYRIVICREIKPIDGPGVEERAADMTGRFLCLFSRVLRRYPPMWHFWDELEERLIPPPA